MEDLGQRQRRADLPEPDGSAFDLDAFPDPHCSARRTAWLIASCNATFCARPGTRTRTSAGVGAGAASTDSSCEACRDVMDRQPEPARDLADVAGRWGAEELLEHGRLDRRRLGKEREDPSPAVVEHHEGAGNSGRLTSPETSWRNARSPSSATVRTPGLVSEAATPSAVETTPSIPFTPRLARTLGGPVRPPRTTPGPGSAWKPPPRGSHPSPPHGGARRATSGSLSSVPRTSAMAACASFPATARSPATADRKESPWRWRRRATRRCRIGGTRSPPAADRPTAAADPRR